MLKKSILTVLCFVIITVPLFSENKVKPDANQIEVLPRDLEIELALSAAPKHLRSEAGIYVLESKGYVKVRESKNGFYCFVARPDFGIQNGALEPNCFGPEAARTILPAIIDNAKYRAQGISLDELERKMKEGYDKGIYQKPAKTGIVYMLSPANRVAISAKGHMVSGRVGVVPAPPHIMFFGHDLNREELGIKSFMDPARPAWLPVLTNQNSYWAWVVTFLGEEGEKEIMNDPESIALLKKMQPYLEKSAQFAPQQMKAKAHHQ